MKAPEQKKRKEEKTHLFIVEADMLYSDLATAVDPVNETFRTTLLSHISRPTSWTFFWVVTMLMTPSGTPARRESYINGRSIVNTRVDAEMLASASASAEKGVSGGGLMTAVQPAASAAPSFRVIIADGKFHGVRIDLP